MFKTFERLVDRACIRPGTSRWLRRSAASYVELHHPGEASRFLGHASGPALAAKHYLDPTICNGHPVRPPEL